MYSCLLTFTFNPIHYCGPPSIHSAVRGDKSSAKYGCVFVLLDLWSPPLGILDPFLTSFSSSAHTHIYAPSPHQFRRGKKIPGAVHCVTSSMSGNGIQTGWKWMPSQQRVELLRVMLIEHKNVAKLKGKRRFERRILTIDWWICDSGELRRSYVFNITNLIHKYLNNCLRVCVQRESLTHLHHFSNDYCLIILNQIKFKTLFPGPNKIHLNKNTFLCQWNCGRNWFTMCYTGNFLPTIINSCKMH